MLGRKAMAMAAPRPAPAETPSMYESTRGFLKTPWREAPETERATPPMRARMILGRRISKRTVS